MERELNITVDINAWKQSSVHGSTRDKAGYAKYKSVWKKVWSRDDYTCQYCGFKSKKYLEIHHINGNHKDNSPDNLLTICPFCHQSFHLDTVSSTGFSEDEFSACIIYLPELSQIQLNSIMRNLFIAKVQYDTWDEEHKGQPKPHIIENEGGIKSVFNKFRARAATLDGLMMGSVPIQDLDDSGSSSIKERNNRIKEQAYRFTYKDPAIFAAKILEYRQYLMEKGFLSKEDEEYNKKQTKEEEKRKPQILTEKEADEKINIILKNFRILPSYYRFKDRAKYWASEIEEQYPLEKWEGL